MTSTVLIVDDSVSIRNMVRTVLTKSGFEVVEACDGLSGVARIEQGGVDFVICDLYMPLMNGIEFVETVKSEACHQSLPILMLTTDGSDEQLQRAKEAGAAGWMVKPFNAKLLPDTIKKMTATTATV